MQQKSIEHRGPDDTKITIGKNWSIGFNRLAIIDLNKRSMQPFKKDGVLVFLNGEIFNYLELIKKKKILILRLNQMLRLFRFCTKNME